MSKIKHAFNYDDMKNGDFPKDVIKKPNKQMRSIWVIGTPQNGEKKHGKHPTQKPEDLLDRVIAATTNAKDIVLDPFCGSATTGVSALKLDRKFVGIDLDKSYFDKLAIPRILDVLGEKTPESKPQCFVNEEQTSYGLIP